MNTASALKTSMQNYPELPYEPKLAESFGDCGYLFLKFKENLKSSGHVGIVAIHLHTPFLQPETTTRSIALFIRITSRKLFGRIEGGYKAESGEFFILLVPSEVYRESDFQQDMVTIREELCSYFTMIGVATTGNFLRPSNCISIEGVFLSNRDGENADNALFRAFQELFATSSFAPRLKNAEQVEIEEIITNELIYPVYQPIVSLRDRSIIGYEALSRILKSSTITNPEELFCLSRKYDLTFPLEKLCRKKALTGAKALGLPGRLFINVCPALLLSNEHEKGFTAAVIDELRMNKSSITIELTEKTLIEDGNLFNRVISHYRNQGFSIAIDDLGAGYAGLKMLAQLEPDYVKLASFLISGIDQSTRRQALVESLVSFCDRIGAQVIAEGIERKEELDYLTSVGVSYGQGYLFGKPSTSPPVIEVPQPA